MPRTWRARLGHQRQEPEEEELLLGPYTTAPNDEVYACAFGNNSFTENHVRDRIIFVVLIVGLLCRGECSEVC